MKRANRLGIAFLALLALLTALALAGELEHDWLGFPTEHLVVHFWRGGANPGRFEQVDGLNPYLQLLARGAQRLEEDFQLVAGFLGLDYDPATLGRVYVFIYPDLESYQEASGCLICAASVGGFIAPLWDEEVAAGVRHHEISPLVVYLTLASPARVILHEFTHVLDFSLIDNRPPTFLLEGLADYTSYRLDEVPDEWELDRADQFVALFAAERGFDLYADYFVNSGYWKFTYEVGTSFIRFLVDRDKGGWERFLSFYSSLHLPTDRATLDRLFQEHYGADLATLEAEWRAHLAKVEITANARALYDFRMDQVLIRYIFLRPLFKDPDQAEALFEEARHLHQGVLDLEAAEALRAYLKLGNLTIDPERAARAWAYAQYLRSYVYSYHRDRPELVQEFSKGYTELGQHYTRGEWSEFLRLYWELIDRYVTWRI